MDRGQITISPLEFAFISTKLESKFGVSRNDSRAQSISQKCGFLTSANGQISLDPVAFLAAFVELAELNYTICFRVTIAPSR